jgi:hypothetical protein
MDYRERAFPEGFRLQVRYCLNCGIIAARLVGHRRFSDDWYEARPTARTTRQG